MNTRNLYQKNVFKNKQVTGNQDIVEFYNEATEDYAFWSKNFNMHFGYYTPLKSNIFKRDSMLNEMNRQVIHRLALPTTNSRLADLGCGMGATMRYALKQHKNLSALGVTLSGFQFVEGNKLLKGHNAIIRKENYIQTSLTSKAFDGAVAIESFCHSGHSAASFKEAFRILKDGGKLVIADAFLKKKPQALGLGSAYAYRKLCNHFSLERLGDIKTVVADLKKQGFSKVIVEDVSFRVAPSVLHVPFAILGFVLKKLFSNSQLKRESLHNLKGSFYALLSGLHMRSFGYFLITCIK